MGYANAITWQEKSCHIIALRDCFFAVENKITLYGKDQFK